MMRYATPVTSLTHVETNSEEVENAAIREVCTTVRAGKRVFESERSSLIVRVQEVVSLSSGIPYQILGICVDALTLVVTPPSRAWSC